MENERYEAQMSRSLLMFLAGGVVGAVLAVLYAPDTGENTRKRIREGADKAWQRGRQFEEDMAGRVRDLVDEIRAKSSSLLEDGKTLAADKKRELLAAIDAGKKALEDEKKRIEAERSSAE